VLRDALRSRFGTRLRPIEDGVRRDGAFYLFTLRLVPLFPFFLVNLLMGLTPIPTPVFYAVSQVGMLPATIAYVYAGSRLAQIERPGDVASPALIGAFVALGLLPLLLRKLTDTLAARRVYRGHRKPPRYDYNLIVIGAGSAGLVSAYIGAAVKARVALIEKHRLGGDCLNTGCVPSKALLRSARLLAEARESARFGIARMDATFDFAAVMARVQRIIAAIEPHDSAERYTGLGVDVLQGDARLLSPWEVDVGGRRISARSIILATGAQPLVPDLPGLDAVPYLTSDTLWGLRQLPTRLLVLGGGPIGCELAQAFARFGSEVSLVEMAPRLLPREDPDAAAVLAARFAREGIRVATAHKALRVERPDASGGRLVCGHDDREVAIAFDTLLVALGRTANVAGFGLEELGVRLRGNGTVEADPLLRTNFPNILVCGDVTGPFQFTHVAAHQAWYAAVNGLLAPLWSYRADYRVIPWCTFTEPEVARVGLSEEEARAQGVAVEVTRYGIDELDRAITDGADQGFVKVLTAAGTDRIVGAMIVGAEAGELIAEFVLAMKHGLGLNKLLGTIHVYPTMMEANRYAAGAWKRAHASPRALRFAERFFAWRRG
jgi:pyruvate/2-oxoglutarate dehydrogenase complex dihydrolipoamide dehydrogenase (E3) component